MTAAAADTRAQSFAAGGFRLSEEQEEILSTSDRFAQAEFWPLQQRMDAEEWWPPQAMPALARMGFLGVTVADPTRRRRRRLLHRGLVMQALARWNHAMALAWVAHENLCVNNIYRNGPTRSARAICRGLCAGSAIGALGLTEPGAGSDALGSMRTTARRDGDHYVLNGSKIYITNGPVADVLLVYAKTDKAQGAKGISAFIVEKRLSRLHGRAEARQDGLSRQPDRRSSVFEECRVPAENLRRRGERGVAVVMSGLDLERAMVALICLGIAERALELALDYAKTRKQFGKPIGEFQMVQAMLADMYVAVETMRDLHLPHAGAPRNDWKSAAAGAAKSTS